jgi:alpha-glucosidase
MTSPPNQKKAANLPTKRLSAARHPWWRGGVIYQAYPRSWSDSNGDGIGDLRGFIERLDYLKWLGVDGLWLNPIMPSPNRDWGYDVSDYKSIHPSFGTLEDFDELIAEAGKRGISIVFDLVPSHTSDRHPWFIDARSSKNSRYRDYYVWQPPEPGGLPPNNWMSYFGRPAWSLDKSTGEYYMHNFSPYQPQLNWWNEAVRAEFDGILKFWFGRGIGGMRLDAVQALLYDEHFRDNPPATRYDSEKEIAIGQKLKYNANRPEVHVIVRRWRALAEQFDPRPLLLGETWVPSIRHMMEYYGNGSDEFDLTWNLAFLRSPFENRSLRKVIQLTLRLLPRGTSALWAISTHDDEGRGPTRWCRGASDAIRCALVLLLTLRGTPVVYYGDEIGMTEPSPNRMLIVSRDEESGQSRDRSRTPMQWSPTAGVGFTTADRAWLPIGDASTVNVETEMADRSSFLWLVHDLIELRRKSNDLAVGDIVLLTSPPGMLAWQRGKNVFVAINLSKTTCRVRMSGQIAICTNRARDQEIVEHSLELSGWEAAVVQGNLP